MTAAHLPWLSLLSKFHPTLLHHSLLRLPHVLTAPTFSLSVTFFSLLPPPPSLFSLSPLNSPLFSFPLLYDPFLSDPSSPLLSPLFCKVSCSLPPPPFSATYPEGWFCFHFCLGRQNCHLLWARANILLSSWFKLIRVKCGATVTQEKTGEVTDINNHGRQLV